MTKNIRVFPELIPLANFLSRIYIPAHVPKYRYRQSMVRLAKFLFTDFSAYTRFDSNSHNLCTVREYFPT